MRALPIMSKFGFPIVYDATHSVQHQEEWEKKTVVKEVRASFSSSCNCSRHWCNFYETHEDPDNAPSDGPNMVPLNELKGLLKN